MDNDLIDFQARAVAASETMLHNLSSKLAPDKCGVSYCLNRQPSLSRLRLPLKVTVVACMVLGISGVAGGAIIGALQQRHVLANSPRLMTIALCCSVGGILILLLPTFVERWMLRRHLPRRDEFFAFGSECRGIHVELSNAPTSGSIRLLADDAGLIYIDPKAHHVKIEGVGYEYFIQSKDVVDLSLRPNGKNVLLSYVIGAERLDLEIMPRSLLAELKRQAFGSSRSFFVRIQEALGPKS